MSSPPKDLLDERTALLISAAKRQWERTFDAISEPLMIIDEGFVIRRANLALADNLGVPVQKVVGRICHDLRAEAEITFKRQAGEPCTDCPVAAARHADGPRDAELPTTNQRVYRLRAYPLQDDDQALTVCRYRDVTEELAVSRKLSNAEKLAAIGRLAGGVAHEINNPLGGILAFTQILLRDNTDPEERHEYLKEIESSALRCKGIVESLLRFARQSPVAQRGPISVNDAVAEAIRLVQYKFAVLNVNVVTKSQTDLPLIEGNLNQIEQVLINLLSNAFDAVVARHQKSGGTIEITTQSAEGRVILKVEDDGVGIPQGLLEKLFDPFFTTKEEGKGTGLGLAVTYALVQEHGGTIVVSRAPSGGACFVVSFPPIGPV